MACVSKQLKKENLFFVFLLFFYEVIGKKKRETFSTHCEQIAWKLVCVYGKNFLTSEMDTESDDAITATATSKKRDCEQEGGGEGEYFECLAIYVKGRTTNGLKVHQVLTRYSRDIRTRLGMNQPEYNGGIMFIEFRRGTYIEKIVSELVSFGAEVQRVRFKKD